MNPIRRIAAHLNMNIESFLNQVENHEAVATQAMSDVRIALQKARAQYYRVKCDSEKMQKNLEDLVKDQRRWEERVKSTHAVDEAKALQCVKRVKKIQEVRKSVGLQLENNRKVEEQLKLDLQKIEDQLEILKRRRNTLASREATANAIEAAGSAGGGCFKEIDEVFERWEAKVVGKEGFPMEISHVSDELEKEFSVEEEKEELSLKLQEILQNKNQEE